MDRHVLLGDEPDALDVDQDTRLTRPAPWRGPVARGRERLSSWVAWFGAGRLAGITVTVVVTVLGGWWLLRPSAPPTEAGLPYAGATATTAASTTVAGASAPTVATTSTAAATSTTTALVVVHVAGAVVAPGVYHLPAPARVDDAVARAGGGRPDAALDALNLAAPVTDGSQVYVPVVGEAPPGGAAGAPPVAVVGGGTAGSAPAGPVDLNRATAAELDELPGIGPATAAAIVAHRDENGPFVNVDDLEAVRGIGPAKLDALRGSVTV